MIEVSAVENVDDGNGEGETRECARDEKDE
jgi:hypothetical protein